MYTIYTYSFTHTLTYIYTYFITQKTTCVYVYQTYTTYIISSMLTTYYVNHKQHKIYTYTYYIYIHIYNPHTIFIIIQIGIDNIYIIYIHIHDYIFVNSLMPMYLKQTNTHLTRICIPTHITYI